MDHVAHTEPKRSPTLEQRFTVLYHEYSALLLSAAQTRLDDAHDAEEVVAEVFAIAWRRGRDQEDAWSLPWLYSTLRNVVGNAYRSRERGERRQRRASAQALAESSAQLQDEERVEVWAALSRLRPQERELLTMIYWEQLSTKEVAAILRTKPGAVRTRLLRARRHLAVQLGIEDIGEQAADD